MMKKNQSDKPEHNESNELTEEQLEAALGQPAEPSEQTVDDPMAALQTDRDELFERLQRVSADYQNYIRRSNQALNDSIELAKGDLAKQFITVLDHFDNALAAEPQSDEARALFDGVKIVRDELLRVLKNSGVELIEVAIGDAFNPDIHEALMRQPAQGVEPNCVSMVMQSGYRHGSRTLRPAKVAVAPE